VAATLRPEIVEDAARDRRFLFQVDQQTGFTTRSMLAAPLLHGNRCVGAVQILNCRSPDARFERTDLEFLEAIAADAAQAIDNARLFNRAQRAEDLSALLRLTRELTATLNLQELLERLAAAAVALTGADRAAVVLLSASGTSARIAATGGTPDPGTGDRARVFSHAGEERYVPSTAGGDSPLPAAEACRSLLAVPLRDADGAMGLLYLESACEAAFSERARELAGILAGQASVAIRNALLYNQAPFLNVGGRLGSFWKLRKEHGGKRQVLLWGLAAFTAVAICLTPWDYRVGAEFTLHPSLRSGQPTPEGAPLEAEILAPEDRILEVAAGQPVALKISALPDTWFQSRVTRIGLAAKPGPGGPVFPVACVVANPDGRLRPGQQGWAKISVGRRSLGYVLTKRTWDWVRLVWWRLW
jgi:GAF domain-containing protein